MLKRLQLILWLFSLYFKQYGNIIKSVYINTNTVLCEIKKNIEFFECLAFDKLSDRNCDTLKKITSNNMRVEYC